MTNLDEQLAALFATRERVRQRNGRTEFLTDDGQWVGTEEEPTVRREQVVRQRRTRGSEETIITLAALIGKVEWVRGIYLASSNQAGEDLEVLFVDRHTLYLKRGTDPLIELGETENSFNYREVISGDEIDLLDLFPAFQLFTPVGRDRYIRQEIPRKTTLTTDNSSGDILEIYRNYGEVYDFQGNSLLRFTSDNEVDGLEVPPNLTEFIYTDLGQYTDYLYPDRLTAPPFYQQANATISTITHAGYLGNRKVVIEVVRPGENILGNLSWISLIKNSNRTVKANGNTLGVGRLRLTEQDLSVLDLTLDTPIYDNFANVFNPSERFTTTTLRTLTETPYDELTVEPINESFLLSPLSGFTPKTAYYVHQWLAFVD